MSAETAAESATPAIVTAALLVGVQIAARASRDALFLSHFDVASLPLMTAGAAAASLFATLAFSSLLTRLSPARVLPGALAGSASLFAVEAALAPSRPRSAGVVLYLHYAVFGAVLVSSFWSLVSERFDPHQAKRSMGAIGAGASLGGVVGGLATWASAGRVSVTATLAALAVFTLLALGSVAALAPRAGAVPQRRAALEARSGLGLVREIPYLRSLALLVLLAALLETVLDYVLSVAATGSLGRGAPLVSFFALFHTVTALLTLALQTLAVQFLLQGPGLAATLGLMPGFALLGAGVAFAFPRLAPIAGLRSGQAVLRNSAFRAGYELLYSPLPPERKRPAKVIVDVGCDRVGALLGSGAVLAVAALFSRDTTLHALLGLAALTSGAALALSSAFRAQYVAALAESLRGGSFALDPDASLDPGTLLTLASLHAGLPGRDAKADGLAQARSDLASRDPVRVRAVLDVGELDPALVPLAIATLADDATAPSAIRGLRKVAGRETAALVAALLDPGVSPAARRRIPRILKTTPTQRAADGLLRALEDSRFDVRYRAAQALLHHRDEQPTLLFPEAAVYAAAIRDCRDAGADAEEGRVEHVFMLLALVLDGGELELARRAAGAADRHLRGTALEYLDTVLPAEMREALFPLLKAAGESARRGRTVTEVRDDLLRSAQGLAPGPRPIGDDADY